MLDGTVLAVFPLALVRDAIRVRKSGTCNYTWKSLGYVAARKMVAVVYVAKDLSFVHCGEFPLVAWVGLSVSLKFGNYVRSCYINDRGQHIYPA